MTMCMMTVHKITGIDGPGYADYLTCKGGAARPGDYYLGRSGRPREGTGTWHGRAAEAAGLDGPVRRADLMRVWEGRDPRTGEVLVRRGSTGDHVAGIDVTFSAPKSMSVLWALSDPATRSAVEAAHDRAVLVALRHIEDMVPLLRRRAGDGIVHERAAGIIASRFRHHTARLSAAQYAAGQSPDPQLHDHVVIANMALRHAPDDRGNLWAAIDSRGLYLVAAEAGAVYRAELAHRLQQMGYELRREGRYVEVAGVSARLRERFSSRSMELRNAVRAFREQYGREPSVAERKTLTLMTREPKSVEHAPALAQWAGRAGAERLPLPLYGPPPPLDREAVAATVTGSLTDPSSPWSVTRTSAVIDDRTLRIAVAESAQGLLPGTDIPWLTDRVRTAPELVRLDEQHWTTARVLAAETEVVATAERRSTERQAAPADAVTRAVDNARVALSDEQRRAVQRLAERGFGVLTAPAGAGKGEVLRAVAEIRGATGHRVIAVAAAGETAQRFGREVGADVTLTVEAFVRRVEARRLVVGRQDAVLVDEAGLLEDWRWLALLRAAGPAAMTVTGDAAQLAPIEAGGLFRVLAERCDAVTLSENFRARDAWAREVWTELREGDSTRAVATLDRRRRIVVSLTRRDSIEAAVEQWDADRREGATRGRGVEQLLLVTDSSSAEVDRLNAAAQSRRIAAGELGEQTAYVSAARPDGGVRREQLREGDRVAVTRQVYLGPAQRRVENGETGTLRRIHPGGRAVDVALADRVVTLRGGEVDALRLGYARHVYSSQGRTVDRVYAVMGGWQTGRESSYVGVSRARESSTVFTDFSSLDANPQDRTSALQQLAERIADSRERVSALGWIEKHRGARALSPSPWTVTPARGTARGDDASEHTQPAQSDGAGRDAWWVLLQREELDRQRASEDRRRDLP